MPEGAQTYSRVDEVKKWLVSFIILLLGGYLVYTRGHYTYLDNFDLIIHEAGHVILQWFGETIYFLGGCIMQIIVPSLLIIFCFYNRLIKSLQFSFALLGQNFINISVYAGDAQTKSLHLFGPPGAKHDWNFILTKYNILDWDSDIAMAFMVLAVISFLVAIITPYFVKE
jgi:hypothetical protein